MRPHFRFKDLEIWQLAKALAVKFHKLADSLDKRRLYRYAEQLRAAGLSLTNNIAEGAGSVQELLKKLEQVRAKSFCFGSSPLALSTLPFALGRLSFS